MSAKEGQEASAVIMSHVLSALSGSAGSGLIRSQKALISCMPRCAASAWQRGEQPTRQDGLAQAAEASGPAPQVRAVRRRPVRGTALARLPHSMA